jgi:hypothetical protein
MRGWQMIKGREEGRLTEDCAGCIVTGETGLAHTGAAMLLVHVERIIIALRVIF